MKITAGFRIGLALAALVCFAPNEARAQSGTRGTERNPSADVRAATTPRPTATENAPRADVRDAQRGPANSAAASAPSPTLETARQRWERLSPEERLRARERYEKYLALSESERDELAQRAQRLKANSARMQRELTPELRDKLSTLEPAKRHELIDELLEGEAKEKGQRIRDMLPESVVKRLEAARPEDRARFLAEFKAQQRKRVARYAIDQLGRRLQLAPQEVERLKSLPDDERARAVLELRKQLTQREADELGPPPGITRCEWETWEALPPEEFFENMQRYRHTRLAQIHRAHDADDGAAQESEKAASAGAMNGTDGDANAANGGANANGANIASHGADANGARAADRGGANASSAQALHALAEARRVQPSDFIDLAPLSKSERAQSIEHSRRERCLAAIRDGKLLPPERIEELAAAPTPAFFEAVRRLLASTPPRRSASEPR
jgi:hypothetical protein